MSMNETTINRILDNTVRSTQSVSSKLNDPKSSKQKAKLLADHLAKIHKNIREEVDKIKDEGSEKFEIKLEFDKLNKRLDVIEAQGMSNEIISKLIKDEGSEEDSKESPDKSISNSLSGLFDGEFSLDDLEKLLPGLGATSFLSGLKKILGTAGKIAIPLAIIAGLVLIYNKASKDKANFVATAKDVNNNLQGLTQEELKDLFHDLSGGEYDSPYEMMLAAANAATDKERTEIENRLSEILAEIKGQGADEAANAPDPGTPSTTAANMGLNPYLNAKSMKDKRNRIYTKGDRIRDWLYGRDAGDDLYKGSMSVSDMSALGSLNGTSVSGLQSSIDLSRSYTQFLATNTESIDNDLLNEPKFTKFDYTEPINSIKLLAEDLAEINKSIGKTDSKLNDNENIELIINSLLTAFCEILGRPKEIRDRLNRRDLRNGQITYYSMWNTLRRTYEDYINKPEFLSGVNNEALKNFINKVLDVYPTFDNLLNVYYSYEWGKGLGAKLGSYYISIMTVPQQCELLGANINEDSVLSSITGEYCFLPIITAQEHSIKVPGILGKISDNDRITLNKLAVVRACYINQTDSPIGSMTGLGFDELLELNTMAMTSQTAFEYAAAQTDPDVVSTSVGNYFSDNVIRSIITAYSGIKVPELKKDKSNQKEVDKALDDQINLANALQSLTLDEFTSAIKNKTADENYNKLLNLIPGQDSSKLDTVLNQVYNEILNESSNSDDIIESLASKESDTFGYKVTYNKSTIDRYRSVISGKMQRGNKVVTDENGAREVKNYYYTLKSAKEGSLEWNRALDELCRRFGIESGLPNKEKVSMIDRIFSDYHNYMMFDEYIEGVKSDLDAGIEYKMGLTSDSYSVEDRSANIDLFGLGTADKLSSLGFSDKEILDFITEAKKIENLSGELKSREDGSFEYIYNNANITPEMIEESVAQALKNAKISDSLIEILVSQGLLTEAQVAILNKPDVLPSNNNTNTSIPDSDNN